MTCSSPGEDSIMPPKDTQVLIPRGWNATSDDRRDLGRRHCVKDLNGVFIPILLRTEGFILAHRCERNPGQQGRSREECEAAAETT